MRYDSIITTEAGLITGNLFQMPNRWFLPEGLFQTSCDSDNLHYVGANQRVVTGAAIGTTLPGAVGSTIGEFCERYCAAHEPSGRLVRATYAQLSARYGPAAVLNPGAHPPYAAWQYAQPGFPYRRFQADDEVAWVQGNCLFSNQPVWVPACLVYLPHDTVRYDHGVEFNLPTSTGVATGRTLAEATQGGFLECAERHAFTTFWYKQRELITQVPLYDAETVVRAYPAEQWVRRLYANPRVELQVFDLGGLGPVETVVTFLRYRYKNQELLSMGAASRFTKAAALVKAALEAYQGIEYGIMLARQESDWLTHAPDFADVDSFHRHFLFYNRFPHLQAQVPMLRRLREPTTVTLRHWTGPTRLTALAEADRAALPPALVVNLTTPDVRDLGLHVVRVITPDWAPITGIHNRPFLGAPALAASADDLFTHLPHPFP